VPDETNPSQEPPPSPESSSRPTSTGLPSNVAAAIACIPLIGGIIFYILEKKDNFVRFYAMQSIILSGALLLCCFVYWIAHWMLAHVPVLGVLFFIILWLPWAFAIVAIFTFFIVAVVKAFSGVRWEIPYIGQMARKQMGDT